MWRRGKKRGSDSGDGEVAKFAKTDSDDGSGDIVVCEVVFSTFPFCLPVVLPLAFSHKEGFEAISAVEEPKGRGTELAREGGGGYQGVLR
ncbi:hypothetical protein AXF42_Ash003443 [Apostasia shenzhenica]|uniref:Uncharacterized protein n=1 Tax=Apostasia shenzhenica TaxID=1088818 RepID=A0A2I0BG58_9ASPA|nr:hypothetical protein AXF42_Ash003443 [Apostasia shenzhenica]